MTTRSLGVEARLDHPQAAAQVAGRHDLRLHGPVGGHRHHQTLRLVEHDGGGRQQKDRRGRRDRDAQPGELARRQEQVRIRHRGARVDRAAGAVERVVDEVERAVAGEIVLVAEADRDLVGERAADAGALAREGQEIGFAHVEIEIERIERDERRQQRRRAGRGAAAATRLPIETWRAPMRPVNGAAHVAIFEIELGIPDRAPWRPRSRPATHPGRWCAGRPFPGLRTRCA